MSTFLVHGTFSVHKCVFISESQTRLTIPSSEHLTEPDQMQTADRVPDEDVQEGRHPRVLPRVEGHRLQGTADQHSHLYNV